jgi:hypothetical protein
MEIMENLWQVGGAEYTSVEDAAIYLIRFGEKAALIDDDYKRSLKFLAGLNADILCEGHFGIYQGKNEVSQFIQTYLES